MNRRRFLQHSLSLAGGLTLPTLLGRTVAAASAWSGRKEAADVLIVGGSLGGVAAALAAARAGRRVILTEEGEWIGGQATTQGVPLDEHPWIEQFGATAAYRDFRGRIRDYYRRLYPLIPAARADPRLNPGAGWVSALCFEPRAGLGVLHELLAPHLSAGRILLCLRHRPVAITMDGAWELSRSVIYWLQTEAPNFAEDRAGFPSLRPCGEALGTNDGLAQYPYIRESTRIRAEFTVLEQHFRADLGPTRTGPVKYPDSVGVSGYRIDIHKAARAGRGSMTEANHGKHWCQQIPLGALLPVRVENLLPACKNLGVTAVTNGAFRVHPTEWNIGESAGALAAFCCNRRVLPRQVRHTPALLADFQRELTRQGVELDWPQLLTARSYYSDHELERKDAGDFYFGEAARLPSAAAASG